MNLFLGDTITLTKGETIVTGKISGLVLDDKNELDRLYIHGLDQAFYFSIDKWLVVDDEEEEENEI